MFKRTEVSKALAFAFGGALAITALPGVAQQQLEKVEITGSAIKRIDAETALPVQVITRDEIARTGVTSTEQLMKTITAISSMGGTENATGAGVSSYGLSSISLRGLGEDRTLVLVNGRRLSAFAGGNGGAVNVNSIPIAAIERVEVLKDGASALYGSDAVAGVVNFILSRNFTGLELGATTGKPTRSGGGKNDRVQVVGGLGDLSKDRFNITATLSLEKETPLFAKDREFAKTGNRLPFIAAAATGQGNIEGGYTPGTGLPAPDETGVPQPGFGTSPGVGYGNPLAADNNCAAINMFEAGNTSKGSPYCAFDSNAFVGLTPKRDLTNLTLNGAFNLTNDMQLFGDALYSRSTVVQQFQPSPLRRSFMYPSDTRFQELGIDPVLLIRPANPNYAIAEAYLNAMEAAHPGQGFAALIGQPLAVTARVFDFGDRTSEDESTQTRLVGGLKGTLGDKDYEVAFAHNKSELAGTVPDGYFSQALFASVVNQADSDYNPWSLTQSATFNQRLAAAGAKYTGATLDATSQSDGIDGKISGELFNMTAGPAQFALGAQGRIEKFKLSPSAALESGDIAGLGGATRAVDEKRKVASVFGELNIPILKELEGNAGVRFDKYSQIGEKATYKGSMRYQPNKVLLFRGALGTGFRAPTLIDMFEPVVTATSEQFNDPGTGQTGIQVPSETGGNPNLKPEKSRQRSAGIVVAPAQNFTFSIDIFQVRIDDIIAEPSTQEIVSRFRAGDPAYAGLVQLDGSNNVTLVRVLKANTGSADVRGADVGAAFRENIGPGRLDLSFNGTYMDKFDQTSPGGVLSHKVGTIAELDGSPVLGADDGGVVLRWKYLLSGTWTQGPIAGTLALNYAKGYEAGHRVEDDARHFIPDSYIYDANVAYTGIKNLRLNIGVKNLFDKDPPIFTPVSNQFQGGYDITQYDPRARFIYVSAAYKFF
jgi:iron complex outermembrane receptor protein